MLNKIKIHSFYFIVIFSFVFQNIIFYVKWHIFLELIEQEEIRKALILSDKSTAFVFQTQCFYTVIALLLQDF